MSGKTSHAQHPGKRLLRTVTNCPYYIKNPIEETSVPVVNDVPCRWNSECPVVQKQLGAKRVVRHIVIRVADTVETISKHRIASDNCRRHQNTGEGKQPAHRN